MGTAKKIWILSGEASGDVYGAKLARELRLIAAEREKLSEADRAQMEVVLRADKDAPMADLADVMDASRRAHAFRLKLTAEASDPGIVRMLPPDPLRLPADSADYALPATNRNDR
jgi:biopolymer transport protein ExbD